MMRKLRKVFVILFLLCLAMPGITFAQKQEKITIAKDGSMKDEQGKTINPKLFALSTYDAEGKRPMEKGKARYRPETMYIDSSILNATALTDAQKAQIKEWMRAERRIAQARIRKIKHNRAATSARKRSTPRRSAPTRVVAVANLSDNDLDRLADKVASKITVPTPSGLSTSEFKKEVDKIVADAKQDFKQFVASNSSNPVLVTDPPQAVKSSSLADAIASAFWTTLNWLYWIFVSWFGILLLVLLVLLLVSPYATRRWRNRDTSTYSVTKTENEVKEQDGDILAQTDKTSTKEVRVSKSDEHAFDPA